MGRKNKKYHKDLHQQAYEKLKSFQAFGESRLEAKRDGTAREKIFSYTTYQTYWKHIKYFLAWLKREHPECTTLKKAKKYGKEWLQFRQDQGISAWTVATEAAALCKLYQMERDDPDRFQPPKRRREAIRHSQVETVRDKHFSATNNDELIRFARGTGPRYSALERLEGRDLWTKEQMAQALTCLERSTALTGEEQKLFIQLKEALNYFPDQEYFVHYRKDKGGRSRFAPIIGPDRERIVERFRNTPHKGKVWQHINRNADIHSYRADYATALYKLYARNIEEIPYDRVNRGSGKQYQGDVYACRKDETGRKLDRLAMEKCSKALGHNRVSVVAGHYLRGI